MKLTLIRKEFTKYSTIGDLLIDDVWFSFTLEDVDRQRLDDGSIIPWAGELKVPGQTAIPYGSYEVITNYSDRFQKVMPLLLDVPDFQGIRIHNGSVAADTEGCPLLGYKKQTNFINKSVRAFTDFMPKLQAGLQEGKVIIDVI